MQTHEYKHNRDLFNDKARNLTAKYAMEHAPQALAACTSTQDAQVSHASCCCYRAIKARLLNGPAPYWLLSLQVSQAAARMQPSSVTAAPECVPCNGQTECQAATLAQATHAWVQLQPSKPQQASILGLKRPQPGA